MKKQQAKPQQSKGAAVTARLMTSLNKAHGAGTFVPVNDASSNVKGFIDTGIPVLNTVLTGYATRGLPMGRVVEVYGEEHVGKTTLGLMAIARCQHQNDGLGCVIDTESTADRLRMISLGVEESSLLYCEEVWAEAVFDQVASVIEKCGQTPAVLFWDTVAATRSKAHDGVSIGHGRRAALAATMSEGMARLSKILARSRCVLLACNQLRDGGVDGSPFHTKRELEATKGGKALRFHSSARIKMEYASDYYRMIKGTKTHYGFLVNVETSKNKLVPNDVRCRMIFQSKGVGAGQFNNALSCLATLQGWGVLPKKFDARGRIEFNGEQVTIGNWEANYIQDKTFRAAVHDALQRHFAETFLGVSYGEEEDV